MGFIANGTVDSFDVSSFTANLATYLSVAPSTLQVTVTAGSVVISVLLIAPAASVAAEVRCRATACSSDVTLSGYHVHALAVLLRAPWGDDVTHLLDIPRTTGRPTCPRPCRATRDR